MRQEGDVVWIPLPWETRPTIKKKKKKEGPKARTGAWAGWDEKPSPQSQQKSEPWQPDRGLELTRLLEPRRG